MFKNTKNGRDDDFFPIFVVVVSPSFTSPPRNCGKTLKKEFFSSSSPRSPREPKWTLFVQNGARHPILSPEGLCVYSFPHPAQEEKVGKFTLPSLGGWPFLHPLSILKWPPLGGVLSECLMWVVYGVMLRSLSWVGCSLRSWIPFICHRLQ